MKKLHIFLLLMLGCLLGCVSYSWKLDDFAYAEFTKKECVTTRHLFLNNREGKSSYAFCTHGLSIIKSPNYEGILVATIPEGYKVNILEAGREKGRDGHVWDYLLGEISIGNEAKPIRFEYLVGLTDTTQRDIPFKHVTP